MAWTYILECADGSYYVGSTIDLDRRVWEHNSPDLGATYTRKRQPVRLVWAADFARVDEAFAFEKRVQGWRREKREALIRGDYASLPVLALRGDAVERERRQMAAEADAPAGVTEPRT